MPKAKVKSLKKVSTNNRLNTRVSLSKMANQTSTSRVVSSDEIVNKIADMNLQRVDAIAVKKGIQTLENITLSDLANTVKVVKMKNGDSYALRVSRHIRLIFGIDEQTKKVLLYDIVDLRNTEFR